ncbi:MAG: radical SAM family heme chaperone HemW [Myxococcota bacterium]
MSAELKQIASRFGVYIHIPFCRRKCDYCDFYSIPFTGAPALTSLFDDFFSALERELFLRGESFASFGGVATIYFGGGTPSLVPAKNILRLIEKIDARLGVESECEITLEANPESVPDEKGLKLLLRNGVNRLSIGCQSFNEGSLEFLGRIHNGGEALEAVKRARGAGFSNTSLDFIFGVPGQSESELSENLEKATLLGVPHISLYELTAEKGTPLYDKVNSGETQMPDADLVSNMYLFIEEKVGELGFKRYEVSNYARQGFESRHNLGYWFLNPYLGLGASAYSMRLLDNLLVRSRSPADIKEYFRGVESALPPNEEFIEGEALYNEFLVAELRTAYGLEIDRCVKLSGINPLDVKGEEIQELQELGLARVLTTENRLVCSQKGLNLLNSVIERLLL